MIRVKVISMFSAKASTPDSGKRAVAPLEEFIAQVGYDNIKNIVVSSPNNFNISYYSIFYEDNQSYTPNAENEPKKKGIFG